MDPVCPPDLARERRAARPGGQLAHAAAGTAEYLGGWSGASDRPLDEVATDRSSCPTQVGRTATLQFLAVAAAAGAFTALVLLLVTLHAARRRRLASGLISGLAAIAAVLVAALSLVILVGTRGYRALTHEEIAARVWTVPDTGRAFAAHVQFPDSSVRTYRLNGDELDIDAHILNGSR